MAKNIDDHDLDLSNFTTKYNDIRRERDLLRTQNHDLEVNLKVAESKYERVAEELERAKAQLESANARGVKAESVIQNVAAVIVSHINPPSKTGMVTSPTPRSDSFDTAIKQIGTSVSRLRNDNNGGNTTDAS